MSSKGNAPNRRVAAIQAKKKRKQPKKSKQGEGQNSNKERERNRETKQQAQPQAPVHHEIDKNRSFEEVGHFDYYDNCVSSVVSGVLLSLYILFMIMLVDSLLNPRHNYLYWDHFVFAN